ncbi:MAG: hypothetical protein L3K02_09545 [Thermoplasmata archaeon]|nr:hypothetical protein [Thermoplasmata archaeon]
MVEIAPPKPARLGLVVTFFRRHPVPLLLALTPGLPEYLSGSTATGPIVVPPLASFPFLGRSGPGVRLVREAYVPRNRVPRATCRDVSAAGSERAGAARASCTA